MLDFLGEVTLQWPRVGSVRKQNKLRKKNQPVTVPTEASLERRTLTTIPEISAQGSLIPADLGLHTYTLPSLSMTGSEGDISAPKPYVTIPGSKPPVSIYIGGVVILSSM